MIHHLRGLRPVRVLHDFVLLTAGAILAAVNVNLFLAPSNIAPGGVTGTAIV